ncbi:EscS/YscS/HrcS family type III secretion system export apparatus protein [Serratia symbiotica]|uniref:EscS/YscS/HrcS family type III secretion system export apparatus protein n=1 Tax=Serratia symbiotica TaxID=138074 RepID=A0A068ZA18_9GAMM|nr:EscS/YscS/HrcS family type III secretion system export apparatus protein [Serratia symbiotica]MBF1996205.1 EscS/YscS/HrcS family type III secretion system export apparatus protein [Serratia symbiotica]MBQ0954628.1 EscS/YscS/HrcS family type III secretion system export apparatus protein [Serratia symbiotica]QLH63681.1 EscS/YscS/HrcS family type III secretion system export apparatus protein [Serratia symbiotica]QTP14071.1 EscS/YscS/HrcS family type III secretion system export apparatus protein
MDEIIYASNKAMLLIVVLSAIPVLTATIVGLLVGLIQTVTQLQEQTLPFGIKLLAVFGTLFMTSGWLADKVISYTKEVLAIALAPTGILG